MLLVLYRVGGESCGCLFSCSLAQRAWNSIHSCTNNNMTNSENTLKFNGETSLFTSSSFALFFLSFLSLSYLFSLGDRGGTVVKVLCYKSEGRWFDSRWCHWKFSLTYSFRSHYGPGVDSASNRNEYQEHFLGVKAAGAYG